MTAWCDGAQEAEHHVPEDAAQQKSYRQSVEALSALQARMHQTEQLLSMYSGAHGDSAVKTKSLEQQLKSARWVLHTGDRRFVCWAVCLSLCESVLSVCLSICLSV